MNFGQNLWSWLQSNLTPVLYVALAITGIYAFVQRKISLLITVFILGGIAAVLVLNPAGVTTLLSSIVSNIFGI